MPESNEYDPVNHPLHYKSSKINCESCNNDIECIVISREFNFNLGNAIKYIWRSDYKTKPIEDLKKAVWYLQDEINQREKISLRRPVGFDSTIIKTCPRCLTTFDEYNFTQHLNICYGLAPT